MKNLLLTLVVSMSMCLSAQDITLPAPQKEGGMPLMEALNSRQSTRNYSDKELSQQQMSNLLWAAFGYNRDGQEKRTAPSSRNYQEIEIYVVLESGLYFYDAKTNVLIQKGEADLRPDLGKQAYVMTAPINLIYVANYADSKADAENNLLASCTNVGYISQNVYLFCTSEGLATVARGAYDELKLTAAMHLPEGHKIILTQTVGFPQ